MNLDASSSAMGALLSDGNFGLFGSIGGTTPAATSPVNVTVTGYTGLVAAPIDLTITDNVTSATEGLQITANGSAGFATELPTGNSFTIALNSYTGGQACTLTGGTGTAGSGTVTIDCERHLVVAASWKTDAGSSVFKLFEVNHTSPSYTVSQTIGVTVGGSPSYMGQDLVWNGTNYLLIWKSSDTVIKGQFYNIDLTTIGTAFTIYTGGAVNIGRVAAAYNSTGSEYAIVWTENASSSAVKYQRITAAGSLSGSTSVIVGPSTSTNYFNADVLWDGSKYVAAFRQKTLVGANSLSSYSFTTSTATLVKTYTKTIGSDLLALDYPSLIMQGSNTWLFFSQRNMDGSGSILDASLMGIKNFGVTPSALVTDTNPSGCGPSGGGDQYYIPSAALNTSNILLSYDVFCGDVGGVFNDVHDIPISISSGTPGAAVAYSDSEIGSEASLGSSIACRSVNCYISFGDEYNDRFFLFDPDFSGNIGGTAQIYPASGIADSSGIQFPYTVAQ